MKIISILLLLIYNPKLSTSSFCSSSSQNPTNSWIINDAADKSSVNFRFYSHSYRSPSGYDVHQCAFYCESDPRCKSFNFLSVEKICELNNSDRKSVPSVQYVQVGNKWLPTTDGLVSYQGSQYFSRDVYLLKSKELLGACHSSPCPENHVCSSIGSRSYQCQKTVFTKEDFLKQWGEWGAWSQCSITCGHGIQERTRQCESPDVWLCEGEGSERKLCDINSNCPMWSNWDSWSECELQDGCGWGTKNRSRICLYTNSTSDCSGISSETNICRAPSCDTPATLSNGTSGDVYIYDDTSLYEPKWRQVCEPELPQTLLTVKMTICSSLGLSLADDDVEPTVAPNDDELVFQPLVCGLNERRLMRCIHNGWIEAKHCGKILAVKCEERPISDMSRSYCFDSPLTFTCNNGKDIKLERAVYGRWKESYGCGDNNPYAYDCRDPEASEIVKTHCDDRPSCTLSPTQFNDVCPGVIKFLLITYSCVSRLLPFYAGVKSGEIKSSQFQSSSYSPGYPPARAQLDSIRVTYNAWKAKTNVAGEWHQIDFNEPVYILGLITQGRPNSDQHVRKFKIAYGNSTDNLTFITSKNSQEHQIFRGSETYPINTVNIFDKPVLGRFIRLVVQTWYGHISLRVEYLVATLN